MRKFLFAVILLSLCFFVLKGQEAGDGKTFISPINHELRLAGTFGELRSNHFHMGIDIKSSNGGSGDPVYAASGGFVSRLLVKNSGYGNAIYIDHPNGYTSVYGHLMDFNEEISNFISKVQYANESFEIDINLDSITLPVAQGSLIGYMGNSGSSSGPHLHFEIRETGSETPVNPLLFGLKPKDNTAPQITGIKLYLLNDKLEELDGSYISPRPIGKSNYKLTEDTVYFPAWRTAIGINTFDPMNGTNKNGIYKISMWVDGEEAYTVQFDTISYEHTRMLNAHIDYKSFKKQNIRFHRCYQLPGNQLPNIRQSEAAIIKLYQDIARKVEVFVSDFEGNTAHLNFWIKRNPDMKTPSAPAFNYYLPYDQPNLIHLEDATLFFEGYTFYENAYLNIKALPDASDDSFSTTLHLGERDIPVHRPFKIYFSARKFPPALKSKMIVADCSRPDFPISYGGTWENGRLNAEVTELSVYHVALDTIGPEIKLLTPESKLSTAKTISFRIDDNYRIAGNAEGLKYRATINGQWALFSYDLKTKIIQHNFAESGIKGEQELILEVWDDRQNLTTYRKKLYRP